MNYSVNNSNNTEKQIQSLREEVVRYPNPTENLDRIRKTAAQLKLMNFDPQPDISNDVFLLITQPEVLARIDEMNKTMSGEESLERIRVLLNNYKFLERLRSNDISAWNEVEELYGED